MGSVAYLVLWVISYILLYAAFPVVETLLFDRDTTQFGLFGLYFRDAASSGITAFSCLLAIRRWFVRARLDIVYYVFAAIVGTCFVASRLIGGVYFIYIAKAGVEWGTAPVTIVSGIVALWCGYMAVRQEN